MVKVMVLVAIVVIFIAVGLTVRHYSQPWNNKANYTNGYYTGPKDQTKIPYNNGFYSGPYNPNLPVIDPKAPAKK